VVRAGIPELLVVREHRGDFSVPLQVDGGIEVDRVECSNLHRIKPGRTFDRCVCDWVKLHVGKHAVCGNGESCASRETA
jgi:hypothetical protein